MSTHSRHNAPRLPREREALLAMARAAREAAFAGLPPQAARPDRVPADVMLALVIQGFLQPVLAERGELPGWYKLTAKAWRYVLNWGIAAPPGALGEESVA